MSIEWYVQSFSNGEEQPIPTQKLMLVFAGYKTQKNEKYIDIFLPDGDITIYMDCLSEEVSGMMISRPINSEFLDRIIYDVMRCGNCIFYAPDGEFPIVLSPETSTHLPKDMLKSLGEPRVAETLESFSHLLKETQGKLHCVRLLVPRPFSDP